MMTANPLALSFLRPTAQVAGSAKPRRRGSWTFKRLVRDRPDEAGLALSLHPDKRTARKAAEWLLANHMPGYKFRRCPLQAFENLSFHDPDFAPDVMAAARRFGLDLSAPLYV